MRLILTFITFTFITAFITAFITTFITDFIIGSMRLDPNQRVGRRSAHTE